MGTRYDDAPYIGLLVSDDRIKTANLRANDGTLGNSNYTQAGPQPGVPEFDQAEVAAVSATAGDYGPSLSLEALGDQDSATSYHVKTLKGGMPGSDATVVRRDALTGDPWRGWNTYNVLGHVETSIFITHDPTDHIDFAMCTTADHKALIVRWDASKIVTRLWDPETRTASANVTAVDLVLPVTPNDDDAAYSAGLRTPLDVLVLPSGRLVIYFLTKEIDGTTSVQLWASYSDDDGATWRTAQYLGLADALTVVAGTVLKMKAAYSDGSVLLVIERQYDINDSTYTGLSQYASDDTGLNFELVRDDEAEEVTTGVTHPDILVDPTSGAFVLLYEDDGGNRIRASRLSSPYLPYVEGDIVTASSGVVAPDHLAAFQSPQGDLYCTYTTQGIAMLWSRDGGATWATIEGPFDWDDVAGNTGWLWDVTVAKGRAVWMITQTVSSGALPLDDDFLICETGGWNTLCQSRVLGTDPTLNRGFGDTTIDAHTWLPFTAPELDHGWTRTGAGGAVTPSGVSPGLNVTVETQYSKSPTGADTDGMVVYWSLEVDSSPSISALEVGLLIKLKTYDISVNFSGTQVRLYDRHAAAVIGTASPSGGMGTEHVFKLAICHNAGANASVTLYRRAPGSDVWATLISGTTTTAGASAVNLIKWGNFVAAEDSTWRFVAYVMDSGSGVVNNYTDDLSFDLLAQDPYVLYGAPLPVPPHKLYVDKGLSIRGTSGPATRGDTWKIEPRFDHPITALDPVNSASPARRWRSTDTTLHLLAWDMTLATTLGNSSIGLFLGGINFPTALFLGWDGAAWVTLATLKADQGLSAVACVVTGDTITVNTAGTVDARYIQYGEFVGGYAKFNGGDVRRIVWNSEGSYTDDTTKRPEFRFEGTAPGGATATVELWHPTALVLLHENATLYSRYGLQIPASTTAEGYFEIGVVLMGGVALFGRKYSRGRVIETAPNYSMRQDQAGARAVTKQGDARRAVSFGWSEVDLTAISGATPDPDFISPRSLATTPTADRHGAPLLVEGLVRDLGGATRPVVYVPNIPNTTGGNKQTRLSSREGYVYGRVTSSVSRQARLGTENQDEVVTLTGVRIEEEV